MHTLGIDMAAEPAGTAIAVVDWSARPRVIDLQHRGVADHDILGVLLGASPPDRAAIDCPLGWPDAFSDFLVEHRSGHVTVPTNEEGLLWRRRLSRRTTDMYCESRTGVRPLSVAADRISAVAMRGAGLQSALAAAGAPMFRDGTGVLLETYPAAALSVWKLPHQKYKRPEGCEILGQVVNRLLAALPGLLSPAGELVCRASDDATDAVLCALIARAAAVGETEAIPDEHKGAALSEGWIHLPRVGHLLNDLGRT